MTRKLITAVTAIAAVYVLPSVAGTLLILHYLINWSPCYHDAVRFPMRILQVRFQRG